MTLKELLDKLEENPNATVDIILGDEPIITLTNTEIIVH